MQRKVYNFRKSDEILERAARIIDEESSIAVFRQGFGYKVAVRLRRTVKVDIDFMHEQFGGYRAEQYRANSFDVVWHWLNIQGGRAYGLLRVLEPFLGRKAECAKIVLDIRQSILENQKRRLTEEIVEYRKELLHRLSEIAREHQQGN